MAIYDDIKRICVEAFEEEAPTPSVALLRRVWDETDIQMHCPEHHFLVPASLLCVYRKMKNDSKEKFVDDLDVVLERSQQITGGFCGWFGACGAAVGAGIFLSVFTDTNPHSKEMWGKVNGITSECLRDIAEIGGPRCCKRVSFTSVRTASNFMKAHFGLDSNEPEEVHCTYYDNNPDCITERCPYYKNHPQGERP